MAIELQRRKSPTELAYTKMATRLIANFEGLSLKAYPDPGSELVKTGSGSGDPWTIGYGHTGDDVVEGLTCTLKQADDWLSEDMAEAVEIVRANVSVDLTPGEFDALVCLAFNLGYIPKSMRACLNGGVTDKGVQMAPGSYGSALMQFPRNCRAAGVPMRGLYRRRLAEACVFSDLPWENACSISVVKLEHINGAIDTDATTSLEDTLMRARQDIPDMRPDPSEIFNKPWPKPELQLDKPLPPASPLATSGSKEAVGAGPLSSPSPSVVPHPPSVSPAPVPVVPVPSAAKPSEAKLAPQAPPRTAPTPPPPKPVVIAPERVNPNALPTNADTSKNMADSTRMIGMVLVAIGSVIQVVTLRLGIGTAIGAVFFDLTRDPVVITLVVTVIVAALGWVTKKNGQKTFAKGADQAQGSLH